MSQILRPQPSNIDSKINSLKIGSMKKEHLERQNTLAILKFEQRLMEIQERNDRAIENLRNELRDEYYQLIEDAFYLNWEVDPSIIFDKNRFD